MLDPARGCWLWLGSLTGSGYGRCYERASGRYARAAHRVMWEDLHGAIPEGMQLDHLCERRTCVNPGHMRVVTPDENKHAYWRRRRDARAAKNLLDSAGARSHVPPRTADDPTGDADDERADRAKP